MLLRECKVSDKARDNTDVGFSLKSAHEVCDFLHYQFARIDIFELSQFLMFFEPYIEFHL